MMHEILQSLYDPVLFAPIVGCILLCIISSIVGTFMVLEGEALVGETIAHACYPGVIAALFVNKLFINTHSDVLQFIFPLIGAAISSFFAMTLFNAMTKKLKISEDAALCFVLTAFFGVSIVAITAVQVDYPTLYKELNNYLFGQAATMTNFHVLLYLILTILTIVLVIIFLRSIKTVLFDPIFAETIGWSIKKIRMLLFALVVFAVVIGIRSVGVVLISAMLILPCAIARKWTQRLPMLLLVAGSIGVVTAFMGVFFSHKINIVFSKQFGAKFALPTGPIIVLVAGALFLFSALFSPYDGFFVRIMRKLFFLLRCARENMIKSIWKECLAQRTNTLSKQTKVYLFKKIGTPFYLNFIIVKDMKHRGWITFDSQNNIVLTPLGMLWARKVVRLHRLWEVYLVQMCGVAKERVHPSAEEMEHIITPEIEKELRQILHNPKDDPHSQPIPQEESSILLSIR